ncbi:hypothetical protein ACHAXT_012425 [Thalassiosira profunda]
MADGRPPSYPTGPASSSQTVTLEGALRLYERGGDAAASLQACQRLWAAADAAPSASEEGENPILSRRHNEAVLQHLSSLQSAGREPDTNESEELPSILSSVLSVSGGAANSDTVQGHNDLVGLYNICLSHYAAGRYGEALDAILGPFLTAMKTIVVDDEGVKLNVGDEAVQADATGALSPVAYLAVTTRIAFLLLDCQLALDGGKGMGIGLIVANKGEDEVSISADKVLVWVEKNALALTAKGDDVLGREGYETMKHEELKFRLHLYRSRMLFAGNKESGEDLEQRSRTARKELKNAMDIFQNVLCVDGDGKEHGKRGKQKGSNPPIASIKGKGNQDLSETTSVTSAAGGSLGGDSEGKGGLGAAGATFEGMPSSPIEPLNEKVKKDTPALQVRHESALYLKANLEQLRGNPAKSLKLCTEARLAGRNSRALGHDNEEGTDDGPEADYDEAIYHNNMGLLHQSAGKVHLALQYYSYALSYAERVKTHDSSSRGHHFWPDGVARPDVTAEILHNRAICAFQAQDFDEAYKCMARCVKRAPNAFGQRARCWLRLAQSCIGIHVGIQQSSDSSEGSSRDAINSFDVGSGEDLNSISSQPMQKATLCLVKAINLSCGNSDIDMDASDLPSPKDGSTNTDVDCYEAALVALAYVKLQMEDNSGALKLCERALRENGEKSAPSAQLREMAEMYSREATIRAG